MNITLITIDSVPIHSTVSTLYRPDTYQAGFYFLILGDAHGQPRRISKSVIINEIENDKDLIQRIDIARKNGYAAVLVWAFHGLPDGTIDLKVIKKYLSRDPGY